MDVFTIECHPKGRTGRGNPNAKVAIVGQSPTSEDMRKGSHFGGRSGDLLKACVSGSGMNWDDLWTTNAMCYNMVSPEPEHLEACKTRLMSELKAVGVEVVFTLGKLVCDMFLGKDKFGTARTTANWNAALGAWIIPTWNPVTALLLESEEIVVDILRDFAKPDLYVGKQPVDFEVTSEVIIDPDMARRVLTKLPKDVPVALDVETYQDLGKLACLAISTFGGEDTVVFSKEVIADFRRADWLPYMDLQWSFHNGLFDSTQCYNQWGMILPIVEDSMLQSYSLDGRGGGDSEDTSFTTQGVHGLKRNAAEYLGAGLYNVNVKQTIQAEQWSTLYKYNGKDATYTAKLITLFRGRQEAEGIRGLYQSHMIAQANVLLEQHIQGTPINVKTLGELAHRFGGEYLRREADLVRMANDLGWDGAKDINANSPKQLARFLYDIRGMKASGHAANKVGRMQINASARSTAEWALESMSGDPFVDNLLELRHVGKMFGTYVQGVDRNLDANNRVHPSPKVHGTVNGRLSYNEPPVQTIPSDYGRTGGENFGRLRGLFAAHEGSISWAADYEQAELWTMYMWSKDQTMLADLMSGDFHTAASESMFKTKRSDHTPEAWQQIRFKSKFVTFGVAFGRSAISLSQNQLKGYTIKECQTFIDEWYKRYSVFAAWVASQKRQIVTTGLQVTPTGRRFKYPVVLNKDAFRKCINHPVSSLAHDHLIDSNIELHYALKQYGASIWFDVHDALLGEMPVGTEKAVGHLIVDIMERPRYSEIGIPVELKIGESWRTSTKVYSGHKWKEGWE